MIIVAYDFESNRRRAKFSKFLKKFGRRIQYSIFELKNSKRVLDNVRTEIKMNYKPTFTNSDSVVIMSICEACQKKVERYGYAENEETEVLFFNNLKQ